MSEEREGSWRERAAQASEEVCERQIAKLQRYIERAEAGGYAGDAAKFREKREIYRERLQELREGRH